MIEKHIILEDIDPLIFYGVNNCHLQMVKSLFPKLRIMARDNVMRLLGDEEQMAKAEEDIETISRCHQGSGSVLGFGSPHQGPLCQPAIPY